MRGHQVHEADQARYDEYIEYLTALGFTAKTIRNYTLKMAFAFRWCRERGLDPLELKPTQAAAMANEFPNSMASRSQLRAALIHFWDCHDVVGPVKAIRLPKQRKHTRRWKGLEDDQVKALLDVSRGDWPRGAVIYLGLYLALRREEIATLRWRDFDHDLEWVRITGKGDRIRDLPVHPKLQEMLRPNRWPGEWVFPGRLANANHVSLTTISNWVSEMAQKAGIGHVHPHQLRYTAAGKVNDELRDIYAAKTFLGHVHVHTTEIYTRVKSDRLRDSLGALNWEDDDGPAGPPENVIQLDTARRGDEGA